MCKGLKGENKMIFEKLIKLNEKQIYKRYTIGMMLLIIFTIFLIIFIKDLRVVSMFLVLGFHIGVWVGFSLRRLVK